MNAIIESGKGILTKVFNEAAKVVTKDTNTEVVEEKVKAAAGDEFISKEELTKDQTTVTEAGKTASPEKVEETWNEVASTVQNETENLNQVDSTIKKIDETGSIANEDSNLSLGGSETVEGTQVEVNTIATEEQFDAIQEQIDRNQQIIDEHDRHIDLESEDPDVQAANKEVRQAYANLHAIEKQLEEYQEQIEKQDAGQNQLETINEEEQRALSRAKKLREDISDFHADGDATIRLQNGAYITNNAIAMDGKGIEVISEPSENNLSDSQVAIKYNIGDEEFERLINTNDKYTTISQTPEENDNNSTIIGNKGLLETIQSSTGSDPVSLNAVAFDKSNGEEVDIENLDVTDGIPTAITVGESKTPEEIEQGAPIFLRFSNVST